MPPFSRTADTRRACKRYALHKCNHDGEGTSAAQCLASLVGDSNPDHFLVATQDRDLQRQVGAVPGGGAIYASANGVHLDPPSEAQAEHARQREARRLATEVAGGAAGEGERLPGHAREQFKRKKAKGPNPLSVLPKKKNRKAMMVDGGGQGDKPAGAEDDAGGRKRKRQRRKPLMEDGGGPESTG
jgi:U3 small nucleolar RNA-associated protein 23